MGGGMSGGGGTNTGLIGQVNLTLPLDFSKTDQSRSARNSTRNLNDSYVFGSNVFNSVDFSAAQTASLAFEGGTSSASGSLPKWLPIVAVLVAGLFLWRLSK